MAGALTISTLNNDTGVLATQNGMTGIAKAWVNFNGTNGTIRDSFNVSSTTRNSIGDYTINFTTVMPNANYVAVAMTSTYQALASNDSVAPTTSQFRFILRQSNSPATSLDSPTVMVSVHGS
jgi:hypothetical protein